MISFLCAIKCGPVDSSELLSASPSPPSLSINWLGGASAYKVLGAEKAGKDESLQCSVE